MRRIHWKDGSSYRRWLWRVQSSETSK